MQRSLGEIYRHYKGGYYNLIGIARSASIDSTKQVAVYQQLYESRSHPTHDCRPEITLPFGTIWYRDLDEFNGYVDSTTKRFIKVSDQGQGTLNR